MRWYNISSELHVCFCQKCFRLLSLKVLVMKSVNQNFGFVLSCSVMEFFLFFFSQILAIFNDFSKWSKCKALCGTHSGPENLNKFRQKNLWNQINEFFCEIAFLAVLNIFPVQKFLKLQKMEFGHAQKKFVKLINLIFLA